ncbi:neuropeptides capa receptor-like [Onthophagus taurus]|uniref:neuropeptides capa receptor-like n=1 Tax=Onthophagus taurus TaxID=166361 RepID=UPI0039BE00BA
MLQECSNITYINDTNVSCNLTPQLFILYQRGPQQLPLEISVPLTVLNVIIFITGLIGNFVVCLVIVRHRTMHSATNYYLFNLAVSDLTLLAFGLPNDVSMYWHQYPWKLGVTFCKVRALLSEMASYGSVLTIVAFSTERYISICHPLYIHKMSGLRRAVRIISFLWFIAFLAALPFAVYTTVHYLVYPPGSDTILEESAFCAMLDQPKFVPLAEISATIFFILPMSVLAFQYTKMGLQIYNSSKQFQGTIRLSLHRDSRRVQAHKTVVRMLAAVVVAFFVCWAPFHCQRLLYLHAINWEYYYVANEWMFYITGILYYLSSTLNPILYNVMSARYRKAFRSVLCGNPISDDFNNRSTRCSQFDAARAGGSRRESKLRSILLDTEDGCSLTSKDGATSFKGNYVCSVTLKQKLLSECGNETKM